MLCVSFHHKWQNWVQQGKSNNEQSYWLELDPFLSFKKKKKKSLIKAVYDAV